MDRPPAARVAGSSATVYGLGAADDRDVAGVEPDRLAVVGERPSAEPRTTATSVERRLVLDPQRPRRVEHRAQQEGAAGARPVEESGDRVHAAIVDDRV